MANAFTKKYLTELIDSRLAELQTPNGQLTADEKLLNQMHRENIEHAADVLTTDAEKALRDLTEAIVVHKNTGTRDSLRQLQLATSTMTGLRTEQKHSYTETLAVSDRIQRARRVNPTSVAADTARLERVKKYIDESPENEFSLTLMKSLGFIDIIKQAING